MKTMKFKTIAVSILLALFICIDSNGLVHAEENKPLIDCSCMEFVDMVNQCLQREGKDISLASPRNEDKKNPSQYVTYTDNYLMVGIATTSKLRPCNKRL